MRLQIEHHRLCVVSMESVVDDCWTVRWSDHSGSLLGEKGQELPRHRMLTCDEPVRKLSEPHPDGRRQTKAAGKPEKRRGCPEGSFIRNRALKGKTRVMSSIDKMGAIQRYIGGGYNIEISELLMIGSCRD